MKKQVLALGLIFTLSVAITNCSRDEAEQIANKTDNSLKKTKALLKKMMHLLSKLVIMN